MTVWRVLKKRQVKAVVKRRKSQTISDIVKKFLGKGVSWM